MAEPSPYASLSLPGGTLYCKMLDDEGSPLLDPEALAWIREEQKEVRREGDSYDP